MRRTERGGGGAKCAEETENIPISFQYIDYLREELRLAEERVEAEALQQQQQLQYANGL